jgi:polysaccharide pyruvyl transferase WcaK-like protein
LRLVVIGVGIGPFVTTRGEQLARDAVRRARFLSVRDDESGKRARALSENTKIVQTFDPVFSLFEEEIDHHDTKKVLTLIPRHNSGKTFEDMVNIELQKGWDSVEILTFEPDDPAEQQVCQKLQSLVSAVVRPIRTVGDVRDALKDTWLVLTERYHGAIAGLGMGKLVKTCSQAPGDKLEVIGRMCEEEDAGDRLRVLIRTGEEALRREFGGLGR